MEMSAASSENHHQRLSGKVAIVTGGANGIGASTCKLFVENGAKVVIADIHDDSGKCIAEKLGENACYIHCDVSNEDEIRNLVNSTVSKYGKLDIMYNNAGIIDPHFVSILDSTKSDLNRLISVNLVGAFLGAKHAATVMVKQGKGCILFTSSACAATGPGISTHTYAVTEYGVMGLCKNLAAELGQSGIRVNCVSPSGVVTEAETAHAQAAISHLKGQILRPEDVAKAALYLASDEANYVSGLNLVVDGGYGVVNPATIRSFKPT